MSQWQLPKGWNVVKVSQVCSINPSIVIRIDRMDEIVDFVPMDAVDATTGTIAYREKKQLVQVARGKTRFQVGDILFAKITPCTENGKVAIVEYLESDVGYGSTEFYVFRPLRGLLSYYLWHWLRMPSIRNLAVEAMTGSSGRQRVPLSFWTEVSIPVPPIPVQRAIVTILNKIDAIQRKQKDVDRIIGSLSLSFFTDTFGDPTTNLKGWEIIPLESLGEIVSGVTKGRHFQGKQTVHVPYLRVANVQDGYLDLSEVKTIEVLPSDVEKYQLQSGDLLLTEGGDPDKLGRGYIWDNEIQRCIHQNHIFRLRLDHETVLPLYLATLVRTHYAKDYFLRAAKRSSKLASINMSQLKAFPVPLPSLSLQKSYIEGLKTIMRAQVRIQSSTSQDKKLFSSLLTRAISGNLTAEWEAANAELIAAEITRLERLPQLALLNLIALRQQRRSEPIGITCLMKFAFLAQKQGEVLSQPTNYLYDFVPYKFGPFAQNLFNDLTTLEKEGWINIEYTSSTLFGGPERTNIVLNSERAAELEVKLAELSNAERADLVAVVEKYGELSHNELLETIYTLYPAYASKSHLRRSRT
jgi:type I restriction enzyme S subunit